MKMKLYTFIVVFTIVTSAFATESTRSANRSNGGSSKTANADFADVTAMSNVYLPKNYVYTYHEAISVKKKLERAISADPNSMGIRWALMRYYVSASNFIGGCTGKAMEEARAIYNIDPYIGCLAYEFVYARMKKFEKAELWYKRSLTVIQSRPDFKWNEITCHRVAQQDIKASGTFNGWSQNLVYETSDGSYSRKVLQSKNKPSNYKLIIDDNRIIERN
ncbi:MAG: tetratricopeptide repeat protein [Chitinophagaceae bacterium]